jgi:hypothetical protein
VKRISKVKAISGEKANQGERDIKVRSVVVAGCSESVPLAVSDETGSRTAYASDGRTTDVSAETSRDALPRFLSIIPSLPKWN